jgi:hypothetical protein
MRTASRGAISLAVLVVLALMLVPTTAFGSGQGKGQGNAGGNGKGNSANNGGIPKSDNDGDGNSNPGQITEDNDQTDEHNPPVGNNIVDDGDNAHPSGKDRSVEHDSGNQGNSESNPDDTNGPQRCEGSCGDPDKPDGWGGEDLNDQDGNNGCGNDDDFDDDNNGNCGNQEGPPSPPPPPPPPPEDNVGGGGDVILPNVIFRHPKPDTIVRGKQIVFHPRPPLQAQLPLTGVALAPLLVLGLGLVTGGAALSAIRPRRNRRNSS